MPPPVSVRTLVLDWHLDPSAALIVILAGGLYLGGVRRLARRPAPSARRWPPARTAAFLAGLAVIVAATMSGLARYDLVLFSLHTLQHTLLGMAAPLLLALGAPMTLALQASRRPMQTVLARVVHHPIVVTLTNPFVAWGLFGGTLFALYFSPLFELSLRNDLIHAAVHAHFVAVGILFCWPAVALDPMAKRPGYPARLLYVLLAVPFHAFLGLAVLSSDGNPLGGDFYGSVVRDWGPSLAADQRTGAGILWAAGELFGLALGGIVVAQWVRADQRRQAREDRLLDGAERRAAEPAGGQQPST